PERMIPFGRSASRSASPVSYGRIRLYTCSSRTRRAINWLYCAPKSKTTIRSSTERGTFGAAASGACSDDRARSARVRLISTPLPHPLGDLQRLSLGRQRGGDDDLRLLHLAERPGAADPHRRAERLNQVLGPIVGPSRAEQDVAQRARRSDPHPRSARERRVRGRHAPVESPA